MYIGFYGHSNCAYRSPDSFLDLIANHFESKIVNTGVKQGSEERILFELKKTSTIDLAIIFHCPPNFLFLPESDRDISTKNFKISRAEDLFREDHLDIDFVNEYNPKFKKLFETNQHLFAAINTYKKYFYHQDLILNRYYGSLMQIDQYLIHKNINAIHIIDQKVIIPNWFEFKSGIVDQQTMKIVKNHYTTSPFFVNCITKEGNKLVADHLINIIAARDRVDKCIRP